jgi:hypothetical protein
MRRLDDLPVHADATLGSNKTAGNSEFLDQQETSLREAPLALYRLRQMQPQMRINHSAPLLPIYDGEDSPECFEMDSYVERLSEGFRLQMSWRM